MFLFITATPINASCNFRYHLSPLPKKTPLETLGPGGQRGLRGDVNDGNDSDKSSSGSVGRGTDGNGGSGNDSDRKDHGSEQTREWSDSESMDDESDESDSVDDEDEDDDDDDISDDDDDEDEDDDDEVEDLSPENTKVKPSSAPPMYRPAGTEASTTSIAYSAPETEIAVTEKPADGDRKPSSVSRSAQLTASSSTVSSSSFSTISSSSSSTASSSTVSSSSLPSPPLPGKSSGQSVTGKGILSTLKPVPGVSSVSTAGGGVLPRSVTVDDPAMGEEKEAGLRDGDSLSPNAPDAPVLKKASTLPIMPKVSLLAGPGKKPKSGRKCVQFQVSGKEDFA